MLCQVCGARNPDEAELCHRCENRLLVLSGPMPEEPESFDEEALEESISLDEHLLERISTLEEAVKRTTETVRQLLTALHKQERNVLVGQTGITTLRDLLEEKDLVQREQWNQLWEERMEQQLLALEKRERFQALKERIAGLHHGGHRELFLRLLEEAEVALLSFDVPGAVDLLEEAFALCRDNYELACFLGETFFGEGELERAREYFEEVLRTRSDHYQGLVHAGVLCHEAGDTERAEGLLQRAVSLYPDAFLPNFGLGVVHAAAGDLHRAVAFLERAVEIDPLPQALFLLGDSLYEMGRLTTAIRVLEEAVAQDPGFEEAHHLLGLAYLDRRWHKKALETFRRAQHLNPKKLQYQDLVAALSGRGGETLPEVRGEAEEWMRKAEDALERGQEKKAVTAYRRALAIEPDNATLLMSYAMVCLQLDRCQEIEALSRRVLERQPGEMLKATAYAALIEALRGQGRYRESIRAGERLLEEGDTSFSRTIALYELSYNLAEMEEDLDTALGYARQSLELAPVELKAFPLAALGWVHYKRGELAEAVDFLVRSSELAPVATTLTHLGMALLASGEEERARTVLAHARRLDHPGGALGETMLDVMKESSRVLRRARGGRSRDAERPASAERREHL